MKTKKSEIQVRFGQTLRAKRLSLDITQEVFAEKAELHRTYIADIERGTRNVSLRNIERIAVALNCTITELFSGIEKGQK